MYRYVDATYHRKGEEGSFMTRREHMHAAAREGGVPRRERSQVLRLFALGFAIVAALAIALGSMLSAAQAAPQGLGALKQFRVPTADSQPRHITVGSDGNLWFTEGNEIFTPDPDPEMGGTFHRNIGMITPRGEITEFRVENDKCNCLLNDIVQGPGDVLYFTTNNAGLGRITTSGVVLDVVVPKDEQGNPITSAIGNGIAAHGSDIWFTDFINNSLWRYNVVSEEFKQFEVPTQGANPYDVAVDANGIVWFTEFHANKIGRLNPATEVITETAVQGDPRHITIASDGSVWFTERFSHTVGRLDPSNNNEVTEFPLTFGVGPEDIVAAPDGSVWFTQSSAGNVARITSDGVITEGKSVKGSEPFGITIGPDGQSVWYTMMSANKIARLTPN
jgi:virginiamycin B lyase